MVKNVQLSPEQMKTMIEKLKKEVFQLKMVISQNGIDLSKVKLQSIEANAVDDQNKEEEVE